MSDGYYPKNSNTQYQSLKVEELDISGSDATLFTIASGNCYVNVLEPVTQVYLARVKVDSSNTFTEFAQSSIVIVDSVAHTAGGDMGAIQITGLAALNPNDCLIVKYVTQE
jgi:hypothetical protein